MDKKRTEIIVTLGPATRTEQDLRKIKAKGVDFVRVNLSHSSLEDLEYFLALAKKVGIPFILDTEGSQVRTGRLEGGLLRFEENDVLRIYAREIAGTEKRLSLKPGYVLQQLAVGDLIHVDFDTLILRVTDVSTLPKGYLTARALTGGTIGSNKAVVIDPVFDKVFHLPHLSPKDYQAIEVGLREGVEHIAVSFVRSRETIAEARRATRGRMKIISKVECVDALEHLDEIIRHTDYILIDRGDLSKEIPLEKIPFTQKIVISKARQAGVGVYVATNLLETMVEKRKPTRAEVQDVVNTLLDGAQGLTLAAETAIGRHPLECINMLNRLIRHAGQVLDGRGPAALESALVKSLEPTPYLLEQGLSALVEPHGGRLVNRVLADPPAAGLDALPIIRLDQNQQMDLEQIALGAYSPLEGFMGQDDFHAVLDSMRLANGVAWPIPIVLDVSAETAGRLSVGEAVGLADEAGALMALLHLEEKYGFDREKTALRMYGTGSHDHPGVRMVHEMQPVLLGGKIDLLRGRPSETRAYELSPRQLRRLFDERGWSSVLGFHTRNIPHRGHEFIQLKAMEDEHCDGLLIQPVVGKKKPGDFRPEYIIRCYENMIGTVYPKEKVVLAAFSTFSRYAGPREAIFTALCRKNYGCSHFIIGRDHTGVGAYYDPYASHRIFDSFADLGITIVRFNEVFYSKKLKDYVHETGPVAQEEAGRLRMISGTQARDMFIKGERPPSWFMRPQVSNLILHSVKNGEQVFEK
jgi:pyruvate kinase